MASNQKIFFLRRNLLQTQAWLLIFTILGSAITPVLGEWVSILDSANVMSVENLNDRSSSKDNLINKSFKAYIYSSGATDSHWYTIDLGTS